MALNDGWDLIRAACVSGTLNFTKYAFREMYGTRFVTNWHHEVICNALDDVVSGKIKKLIINIPPRYSKTEIAIKNFVAYCLALNPAAKFIHLSYSDDLAHDNSETIREVIKSDFYQRLFPFVQIKRTSDSKKKWYTTEGGGVYATASGGQITGFGAGAVDPDKELGQEIESISSSGRFAGAILIDDFIKPEDAESDLTREKLNNRFESTIRNRVNSRNTPIIIIMQRLHEHDLSGYLMEKEPDKWTVIELPAISYDKGGREVALWPHKHTLDELHEIERISPYVFQTQYMQNPTPKEGLLYDREFKTYDVIPTSKRGKRKAYIDTADTGSDYLCAICYEEQPDANYVTDVLYTKKPMEYTEPKTVEMLILNQTETVTIESNNGGRGFARNIERLLREQGKNRIFINWFHQNENKAARIFTRSSEVMNLTRFPSDWKTRWSEFATALLSYRKEGGNRNDDAPDSLTGTVEKRRRIMKVSGLNEEDTWIF